MIAAQSGRQWGLLNDTTAPLLDIAILLDLVCEVRRQLEPTAGVNEMDIRRELFTLLDEPTQPIWERVREIELYPAQLPGLDTPSPLGVTVGDIVYNYGVSDVHCPSQPDLMAALRRGLTETGGPLDN